MAEIRIQTGWGEELSAQAYECLQLIREASSMLASLNLDPALRLDREIHSSLQKLTRGLEETEGRMRKAGSFLEPSMQKYEALEKKLVEKARGLGTGFYLPEISSPGSTEQLRKLFQEEAPMKQRV